jgi:hypothetical protein
MFSFESYRMRWLINCPPAGTIPRDKSSVKTTKCPGYHLSVSIHRSLGKGPLGDPATSQGN